MSAQLWDSILFWRGATGALATLSLGLLVAAVISREPADFSAMPLVAVVRDSEHHPVWAIRLARAAHQIAADSLRPQPAPPDRVYQLWLLAPNAVGPRPLGLLPQSSRKRIAVTPENARLLEGEGELEVSLEPVGGSTEPRPTGPVVFRASLEGAG